MSDLNKHELDLARTDIIKAIRMRRVGPLNMHSQQTPDLDKLAAHSNKLPKCEFSVKKKERSPLRVCLTAC